MTAVAPLLVLGLVASRVCGSLHAHATFRLEAAHQPSRAAQPTMTDTPAAEVLHRRQILDIERSELDDWMQARSIPRYRACQVYGWLFTRRAATFEEMTDLPRALRSELERDFCVFAGSIAHHDSASDGTEKLLVRLPGGGEVECVLLRDGTRRSICVSSQVGCAMGCVFCASGLDGVERSLTRGEILEQMLRLQHLLPPDERLSHIVMMGMGEPLANLDRVLAALSVASSDSGLGISPRRITISTVGLPKAIDRMVQQQCRYNLAVSLHAPDDELRSQLVPTNAKTGIRPILEAADRYFDSSGRRLTFEYVLLGGVNDSQGDAQRLARLLARRPALLNVIPYNPVAGLPYRTPSNQAIQRFRQVLEAGGINVQFRQRKGNEIDAACGQLRRGRRQTPVELHAIKPGSGAPAAG